jgi:hypothetical protein
MCIVDSFLRAFSRKATAPLSLLFVLLISMSGSVQSAITTYTDEVTCFADLSLHIQLPESFEDSAWNLVPGG